MKPPNTLLAKSVQNLPNPDEGSLVTHTLRVVEAADSILRMLAPELGNTLQDPHRLNRLVLAACFFHDLGKASSAFQELVQAGRAANSRSLQPIRHELLSFLIMMDEKYLGTWLRGVLGSEVDTAIAACSAGGHHLKLNEESSHLSTGEMTFYGSHCEVEGLLRAAAAKLALRQDYPTLPDLSLTFVEDLLSRSPQDWLDEVIKQAKALLSGISSPEDIRQLAFTKALTIAADVAGSALAAADKSPAQWISEKLGKRLCIVDVEKIVTQRLKGKTPRRFQERVSESDKPVTVVTAGCGNGKTLAAYMWASKYAAGRKLFFCYPTTGTASAGYEDYLHAQDDLERALIHSRSTIDIEFMAGTPDDDAFEENQRLESLKAWGQQVIVCTADTVLGLVQNQRRGLFSFPAISSGAFVFDEVHNYDKRMFGGLLRFLEAFECTPVLIMSASIPARRLKKLREVLGERMTDPVTGEPDLESLPRYVLRNRASADACWPEVEAAIKARKQKVLWVCNTVRDARLRFREAKERNLQPVFLYHSRFRYRHRVDIQKKVLQQFQRNEDGSPVLGVPALIIATQVCEMSLDISADLMVTALPPFPSLIQRLGRLNRYAWRQEGLSDPLCAEALIYPFECADGKPYLRSELQIGRQTIEGLYNRPLSQADLADALNKLAYYEEIETDSAWLDGVHGVWESDQLPLRKGDVSLTILMEQDLKNIEDELRSKKRKPNAQSLAGWTVPMVFKKEIPFRSWNVLGGYRVAPKQWIHYDDKEGAEWLK